MELLDLTVVKCEFIYERALSYFVVIAFKQDRRIERFKDTELTVLAIHDLTIRALDAGVLYGSMVPKALQEYRQVAGSTPVSPTIFLPRKHCVFGFFCFPTIV